MARSGPGAMIRRPAVRRRASSRRGLAEPVLLWCAVVALWVAALPASAGAQGFLHWPQSPRATAMGGAGAGLAAGPGAAFHAPAGIAWLDGTQLEVGARLAASGGSFHAFGEGEFDRDGGLAAAPTVFATHAIARNLTGGLAITSPWDIDVDWRRPDEFAGRFLTSASRLTSLDASITMAWRAGERWALSIGPDIVYLRLDRDRLAHDPALSAIGGEGPIALARAGYDVDGTAIGLVVGAFGTPHAGLSLGASFRTPTEVSMEGLVDFTIVAPEELKALVRGDRTIGDILEETYVDQSARVDVPLPWVLSVGAAWEPLPSITLAVDAQRVGWGEMEDLDFTPLGPAPGDLVPLDWKDVWAWRIGAEIRRSEALAFRMGYAREESPAPRAGVTPLFPDAEREALSGGVGFRLRGIDLEVAYRLTVLDDREGVALPSSTPGPDGVYESTEHDVSIAVVRRF